MNEELKQDYKQMVRDLAKNGDAVIADMTGLTAHYLHMSVGLCGEIGELAIAVRKKDRENIIEELGDAEFYLEGIVDYVTPLLAPVSQIISKYDDYQLPSVNTEAAWIVASSLMDFVKKAAMYAKPLDEVAVAEHCLMMRSWLDTFYIANGIKRQEVLEYNMHKLLKGKNARYKGGKFTNAAAQKRSDKEPPIQDQYKAIAEYVHNTKGVWEAEGTNQVSIPVGDDGYFIDLTYELFQDLAGKYKSAEVGGDFDKLLDAVLAPLKVTIEELESQLPDYGNIKLNINGKDYELKGTERNKTIPVGYNQIVSLIGGNPKQVHTITWVNADGNSGTLPKGDKRVIVVRDSGLKVNAMITGNA